MALVEIVIVLAVLAGEQAQRRAHERFEIALVVDDFAERDVVADAGQYWVGDGMSCSVGSRFSARLKKSRLGGYDSVSKGFQDGYLAGA